MRTLTKSLKTCNAQIVGVITAFVLIGAIAISASDGQAESVTLATGEWPPYASETRKGYGFITEILSEVFERMGVEPIYEFHSWEECYELVKHAQVWGAFPYGYTVERGKHVLFSSTVGESTTRFFYYGLPLAEDYTVLEDLKSYRIVGVKGYFYETDFQRAGLNVSYVDDETQALEELFTGQAELMPLNELVGWEMIKKIFPNHIEEFGTLENPYNVNRLKMIVSKDYPDSARLLKKFNKALARFKKTKTYHAILRKYGLKRKRLKTITW